MKNLMRRILCLLGFHSHVESIAENFQTANGELTIVGWQCPHCVKCKIEFMWFTNYQKAKYGKGVAT